MYRRLLHQKFFLSLSLVAFIVPSFVFAADAVASARGFVDAINKVILFPLIALMMAVALLIFLYGAYEYVLGASNETARDTGRKHLLWGIIGLLVMLSASAILTIAAGTFNLNSELEKAQKGSGSTFNNQQSSGFTLFGNN